MVTISVICPFCGQDETVRRYGANRSGTSRCYCNACCRAFTLNPRPRQLDEQKADLILSAVQKKMPVTTICRTFKVSPKTVYALVRNAKIALCLAFGMEEGVCKRDMHTPKSQKHLTAQLEIPRASKWNFLPPAHSLRRC